MNYEREYSDFPNSNITLHNFKNIDDSGVTYTLDGTRYTTTIAELVNQIQSLQTSSLTSDRIKCAALINANKSTLTHYIADAETFNGWEQEIYNSQLYAKYVLQSVHFGVEEPECQLEDVWIGGEGATNYD